VAKVEKVNLIKIRINDHACFEASITTGTQVAVGVNGTEDLIGNQLALGANLVTGPMKGSQIAVGGNSAYVVLGAQTAVGYNHTVDLYGAQLGAVETAEDSLGVFGGVGLKTKKLGLYLAPKKEKVAKEVSE
jgi:hypothetical protein